MIALPEGVLGKALALGICILLFAIIDLVVVDPLLALYEDGQQQLAERSELVGRLKTTVRDLPNLRAAAASSRSREKSAATDLLLPASGDAVAAATLQSIVKQLVADGGATLASAEILSAQTQDNFRRVGIRASFSGNLPLLTAVLQGIETAHPSLFVDNLEIRGGGEPVGGVDPPLAIVLEVYGFLAL